MRGVRFLVFCLALLSLTSLVFYANWYCSNRAVEDIVPLQILATPPPALQTLGSRCSNRSEVGGFVAVFRYWEQQTQALKSLAQLQCLATHMGMPVVEPFLYKSFLGLPPEGTAGENHPLHLSDLVDVGRWNRETESKFGLLPLAQWSEFLENSPRDVIALCVRYQTPPHVRSHTPGLSYRMGCPTDCYNRFDSTLTDLSKYGEFRIVRRACANFAEYGGVVMETKFIADLFAEYDRRQVTVLINEFRGFFGLYRAHIVSSCGIDFHKPNLTIAPSAKIVNDARKYVSDALKGEPFVAVLARIERVVLHLGHNLTECGLVLKSVLRSIAQQHNTKQLFVAMDVGRFGSSGATVHNLTAAVYGSVVLDAVYDGTMSFSEWESTFEKHTSRLEGAYVANLQRTIASRARCLVMFGAGGFQAQARDLYEREHPDPGGRCIYKICHDQRGAAPLHVHLS